MRVVNQISFEARDDADALRLAAERLGKDAVILSTRAVRVGGILGFFQRSVLMVTAGILEEEPKKEPRARESRDDELTRRESLIAFQKLMEFKERSSGTPSPSPSQAGSARAAYAAAGGGVASSADGDSVQLSSEGLNSARHVRPEGALPVSEARMLKDEVGALSQRLDSLMERLGIPKAQGPEPQPARADTAFHAGLPVPGLVGSPGAGDGQDVGKRLRAAEVDEGIIKKLLADYGSSDRSFPFVEWLASRIPCSGDGGGDAAGGRKVMFLGPTGVGKTTTIAKLAAVQALLEHRNVLLLTSDTYRIAAVDQLRTYAKILGVPLEVVFGADSFPSVLDGHSEADLVLLDTAGRAQRDRRSLEAFKTLYDAFAPDAVHLVLAANMKYGDMMDVVEHIPDIPVSHLIFTKLDETVSCGAVFSVQQTLGRPVSFLTAGQNVPNDIETASGRRIADLLMSSDRERRMA